MTKLPPATDNVFKVTVSNYDPDDPGTDCLVRHVRGLGDDDHVTVKNNTTEYELDTYTLQANASSTENTWLLDVSRVDRSDQHTAEAAGADQQRCPRDWSALTMKTRGNRHDTSPNTATRSWSTSRRRVHSQRSATITVDTKGPGDHWPQPGPQLQGARRAYPVHGDRDRLRQPVLATMPPPRLRTRRSSVDDDEAPNKATKPDGGSTTVSANITLP